MFPSCGVRRSFCVSKFFHRMLILNNMWTGNLCEKRIKTRWIFQRSSPHAERRYLTFSISTVNVYIKRGAPSKVARSFRPVALATIPGDWGNSVALWASRGARVGVTGVSDVPMQIINKHRGSYKMHEKRTMNTSGFRSNRNPNGCVSRVRSKPGL